MIGYLRVEIHPCLSLLSIKCDNIQGHRVKNNQVFFNAFGTILIIEILSTCFLMLNLLQVFTRNYCRLILQMLLFQNVPHFI